MSVFNKEDDVDDGVILTVNDNLNGHIREEQYCSDDVMIECPVLSEDLELVSVLYAGLLSEHVPASAVVRQSPHVQRRSEQQ